MLMFRRLHEGFYIANADGTTEERLGEPVWEIRTTPALLSRKDGKPYRIADPDGYIVAEGLGLSEAMRRADELALAGDPIL